MFTFMESAKAVAVIMTYITCLLLATVTVAAAPPPFFSCTDYHCDEGQAVQLSEAQWQSVRELFDATSSAAEERQQLRRAIARLEQEVGVITGTWRDLAKNVDGAGLPGQLDCIAESKNTTTYLQLLSDAGLLKWHQVEARAVRHPLIFNVHWSAVIREKNSDQQYAVDSWFLENGQPPYIQPLETWKSGRNFDR
jgi:hypothetical protein